jgi:hypothetical protein
VKERSDWPERLRRWLGLAAKWNELGVAVLLGSLAGMTISFLIVVAVIVLAELAS